MEKDYEIDIEEERMRNKFVEFLVVLLGGAVILAGAVMLAVAVFSLPAALGEGQERPKLDCQKMALDYAQALESLDVRQDSTFWWQCLTPPSSKRTGPR